MSELQITLNDAERDFLRQHLAAQLKEVEVEEHRTRDLNYRGVVTEHRQLIENLLEKLGVHSVA